MISKIFGVNKRVELRKKGENLRYKSTIQEMDKETFSVAVPSSLGQFLLLHQGEQVFVTLFGDRERFEFSTIVKGRHNKNIPLYILAMPTKIDRIQSRNFVRIPFALEVLYEKIDANDFDNLLNLNLSKKTLTKDISGGGCLLLINEKLKFGDLLCLKLKMPSFEEYGNKIEEKSILLIGQVTRRIYKDEAGFDGAGICFKRISEKDRESLIKFIFYRMREQAKLKR